MERIVPYFWFNTEAEEAIDFYLTLFEDSKLISGVKLENTPSGDNTKVYEFQLAGQSFGAVNGGAAFQKNPSISLTVLSSTRAEVQKLWDQLSADGKILQPLQEYGFNDYYGGWVEDDYGLTWQLMGADGLEYSQKIMPSLIFSGPENGRARDAITYYTNIFQNGKIVEVREYEKGQPIAPKAEVKHATFEIMDFEMYAADNGEEAEYTFNEAVSLMVRCVTQAEIDYYWEKLSADPEAEQCGWLKDKFGVFWQIVPVNMSELLTEGSRKQVNAVTEAFLPMKKLDKEKLERIWERAAE